MIVPTESIGRFHVNGSRDIEAGSPLPEILVAPNLVIRDEMDADISDQAGCSYMFGDGSRRALHLRLLAHLPEPLSRSVMGL